MRTSFQSDDFVDPFYNNNNNRIGIGSPTRKSKQTLPSSVLDVPLITVNKLVFRSKLDNGTYKPMDMLTYANLLKQLKEQCIAAQQQPPVAAMSRQRRSASVQIKEKLHIRPKLKHQSISMDSSSTPDDVSTLPHPHPFNRNRRSKEEYDAKALKAHSILLEMSDEIMEGDYRLDEIASDKLDNNNSNSNIEKLEEKFENFMKWVNQAKQDYVAMETVNSLDEFPVLFRLLEKYTSPTLLQIKANSTNGTWTVVCQPLEDFKEEFMVLRIGLKYCLCLEPF